LVAVEEAEVSAGVVEASVLAAVVAAPDSESEFCEELQAVSDRPSASAGTAQRKAGRAVEEKRGEFIELR
jgi:hypothetical protein